MSLSIIINWKTILALGVTVSGTILVVKMSDCCAEQVSIILAEACKEYAIAKYGTR